MPESFWTDPLMYQGGSDEMLPPRAPIPLADEAWGCDCEAEVVVVTDDVPQRRHAARRRGTTSCSSAWSTTSRLRNLIPAELGKGFGFLQSKPASALSPVLRHPRGARRRAGRDGKLHGALKVDLNGKPFGRADAGDGHDLRFRHPDRPSGEDPEYRRRLDHRLRHRLQPRFGRRPRQADRPGRPRLFAASPRCGRSRPSSRARPKTEFLKRGDTVRIWMDDEARPPDLRSDRADGGANRRIPAKAGTPGREVTAGSRPRSRPSPG